MEVERIRYRDGYEFVWVLDTEPCIGCMCGSPECPCLSGEPHLTEGCMVFRAGEEIDSGSVPAASLWGICEATPEYRLEIEDQLLAEVGDPVFIRRGE